MKIEYTPYNPKPRVRKLIHAVELITDEWKDLGYSMTLRQVYYQLVSRNIIANSMASYKSLSKQLTLARIGGLLDWDAILDRTRSLQGFNTYDDVPQFLHIKKHQYKKDLWEHSPVRVEIWVEKEALAGIVGQAADEFRCDYFACKGYVSSSAMKETADRFKAYAKNGQDVAIVYLGDHDPSGVHMTEDIRERLSMMGVTNVIVDRIGLTLEQIEDYQLPPNPAKLSDSRSINYIEKFGDESWELDALPPNLLADLIKSRILDYQDAPSYSAAEAEEAEDLTNLDELSRNYESLLDSLYAEEEEEPNNVEAMEVSGVTLKAHQVWRKGKQSRRIEKISTTGLYYSTQSRPSKHIYMDREKALRWFKDAQYLTTEEDK